MSAHDRECDDVLNQVAAIRAAVHSLNAVMREACARDHVRYPESPEATDQPIRSAAKTPLPARKQGFPLHHHERTTP